VIGNALSLPVQYMQTRTRLKLFEKALHAPECGHLYELTSAKEFAGYFHLCDRFATIAQVKQDLNIMSDSTGVLHTFRSH
jgi:hypothetical protein